MGSKNNKYVIVDIDGAIADCTHRLHHIQGDKKDWNAFYSECEKDKPYKDVIEIIQRLSSFYDVLFITGRREAVRYQTQSWIEDNLILYDGYTLNMRQDGDKRKDCEVKLEILDVIGVKPEEVLCIFEDRTQVVKAYREAGYRVLQVKDGDY